MPSRIDAPGDRASAREMSAVAASLRNASPVFRSVRFALRQRAGYTFYGRGAGVGRGRGVAVVLPLGVAVGVTVGLPVAVAVAVGVAVAVPVAVAVGVGVGVPPPWQKISVEANVVTPSTS